MRNTLNLFTIIVLAVSMSSCSTTEEKSSGYFGEEFEVSNPISPNQIETTLANQERVSTQVKGTVEKVCKMSQCWMTVTDDNGNRYYLNVKDEAFKLPKDCVGKTVVANGDLLSISAQQEAAREKGLKESYIESISSISMEATGYVIEE